jgi:hypothetical protein
MKVPAPLAEVRRLNLKKFIDEKFDGNRAAFSRAAGKNANLIVLALAPNEKIRRSIGERLARDIEETMGLPNGWLDLDSGASFERYLTVPIVSLESLSQTVEKLFLSDRVLSRACDTPTSMAAVRGLYMPSSEMLPAIGQDDLMLVDTGCDSFVKDGVYVITINKSVFIRRVRRLLSGDVRISADSDPAGAIDVPLGKYKPVGRVVGMMKFGQP